MAHISISPEQILQQLEEILNSSLFENKNRLKRFLSYVVNETLNGNAQLIKGYTLGLEVFDKDESFNPQEDAIVRVEAGRLRRLLENYYLDEGKADPVLITLPKGKYQPEFLSKKDIEPENSSDPIFKAAAAPPTGPAIAVLPFEVIGEQESASIFAVGITEEIINHLSLSPSLYVISRKITSLYKDKDIDIRELSKELETHYVLEGSIRQAAQSVRVNGQLLNGTNGAIIWTEKFDYQLSPENIITVQDEIASKVSATIGDAYGTIMRTSAIDMKRSSTDFMEAYEAMLLFHDYLFDLSQSSHLKARNSLKKAVEIDPHYADAWAGLSFLALDEYRFSFNLQNDKEPALTRAKILAKKAISLNPQHPNWCQFALFHNHFLKGEFEKAKAYVSTIETPDWFWPYALQAINYAELGERDACNEARENVLRLYPDFPINVKNECSKWFHRKKDADLYLKSFKKAGLIQ